MYVIKVGDSYLSDYSFFTKSVTLSRDLRRAKMFKETDNFIKVIKKTSEIPSLDFKAITVIELKEK